MLAYATGGADDVRAPGRIVLIRPDGTQRRMLTAPTYDPSLDGQREQGVGDHGPGFSPDGTTIVFSRHGTTSGSGVYVMDAAGSGLHRLWTGEPPCFLGHRPSFSPDGSSIVFAGRDDRFSSDLYVMRSDGSDVRRITVHAPFNLADSTAESPYNPCNIPLWGPNAHGVRPERNLSPAWSPDGTRIVFSSNRNHLSMSDCADMELFSVRPDGGDLRQITRAPDRPKGQCPDLYVHYTGDLVPSW